MRSRSSTATSLRTIAEGGREISAGSSTTTASQLSSVDLLQSALNDDTRSHFEALSEHSTHPPTLSVWTFLHHFMNIVERIHQYQHRKPLAGEEYLRCKRVLYAAFLEMDKDDDGLVRYEDLLDYLTYRRSLLNEMPKEQVFVVEQSYFFRFSPGIESGAKRPTDASSSSNANSAPDADEEETTAALTEDVLQEELAMKKLESVVLSFDQPGRAKFLTGKRRGRRLLGMVNKNTNRDVALVDEALQVVDGFSCGSATPSPIVDLDCTTVDELVVTSHADRTIRIWSDRDCRGLNRGKWREAYHHTTSSIVTTVCSHPRSERLFTGGSDGEIVLWRVSNALLLDKLRGDRSAFDQLVVKVWEAGSIHRDSVKAIAAFERVDRIASCALDGSIGVIDVPRQCELQSFRSPRGILSIAVCESFSLLCTAGYDRDPFVWDYTAALRMPTRLVDTADPHTDCIVSVAVLEGATTLIASCDASSKLKIWDLRMLRCVQSLTLDREGVERNATAATRSSAPQNLVSTMLCTSSAGSLSVVGRKWFQVGEQKVVHSKSMGPSPAIRTAFDMQTGSLLALHEDSSISVWFSGARRAVLPQKQLTHSKQETVKTMEVFSRGRRVVLGTSDGRIVIVNVETASVGESVEAFPQKAAVKTVVLGTFDARPFISALAVDGSLFHWYHPALAPHSVLPPHVHVTALAVGNMEASLWLGTATGSVYHLYLVESFTGPELLSPAGHQPPSPVTHLVRLHGLGVMALLRSDNSFVLFNANFEGELLHQQRLGLVARSAAAIPHSRRDSKRSRRTAEAYLALGDDSGRVVVIRVSSGIFHPNNSGRARHCVSVADRLVFSQAVLSLEGLAHWSAFAAVCEDGTGKILDRYGVELAVLAQYTSQPWPAESLPVVTNAEHSARVVAKIHAFFSLLRSRAAARKRTETLLLERRRSTMRRTSRYMSFSRKADESGDTLQYSDSSVGGMMLAGTASFLHSASGVLLDSSEWGSTKKSPRNATFETPPPPPCAGGRGWRGSLGSGEPSAVLSEAVSLEEVQPLHPVLPRQAARPTVSLHRVGMQRPASAPSERERLAATVPKEPPRQHIIGSEGIRKAAVAMSLQRFVGQVATVGGDPGKATQSVPSVLGLTRVGNDEGTPRSLGSESPSHARDAPRVECSHRCVLGPAVDRVKLQMAMEEQELPPSVLWAPLPRPPSPLESRVQRRSKR